MNEELQKALKVLLGGGTVLYPTDTVWGIGCDASNEDAVQKIFRLKQRVETKSMIVLVAEPTQVGLYADIKEIRSIAGQDERPLTVIYSNAQNLAKSLIAKDGTIAIRVVKDEFCRKLIGLLKKPIVSTSSNISGEPAPANFSEISEDIKRKVDYVVNWRSEETKKAVPSKIIKLNPDGTIEIIRP